MNGLNKVLVAGHIGADPICRYMPNGGAVTNFSVATNQRWKDKQTGEQREATEWIRVVAFGRLAEIARDYLGKGTAVFIDGAMRTRSYEKDGVKQYRTEVIANEIQLLTPSGEDAGKPHQDDQPAAARAQEPAPLPRTDFDDDIPF